MTQALETGMMAAAVNAIVVLFPLHFELVAIVGTETVSRKVVASQQVQAVYQMAHWRSTEEHFQNCHVVW